jgi:hypothetical protein
MEIQTITANYLKTICWKDNMIVDWAAGTTYFLDGKVTQFRGHYAFGFDSAINSLDGSYVFIYQKLGTKGLLLKNGELIREINRSYYCANAYEFPVAFITLENKTYLIHCPIAYNQLDFEDVETGEIITNIKGRKPDDRFHSMLEVNPNGTLLMSKGWVWHPLDEITVFDIRECFRNPLLLDSPQFYPNVGVEICTASFIDENTIVIGSSNEVFDDDKIEKLPSKHICLWDLKTDQLSKPVKIKEDFGNLFAINSNYVWDLFCFPKIIDINTGEIIEQNKDINSGKQQSAIISATGNFPSIIFNKQTKQIAIKANEKIEVLTPGSNIYDDPYS